MMIDSFISNTWKILSTIITILFIIGVYSQDEKEGI